MSFANPIDFLNIEDLDSILNSNSEEQYFLKPQQTPQQGTQNFNNNNNNTQSNFGMQNNSSLQSSNSIQGKQVLDDLINTAVSPNDLSLFNITEFLDFDVFNSESTLKKAVNSHTAETNIESSPISNKDQVQIKDEFENNNTITFQQVQPKLQKKVSSFTKSKIVAKSLRQESLQNYSSTSNIDDESEKRRRNTAASARFRYKKKLREMEMETKTKELMEKIALLEQKAKTLEVENKCLENLIIDMDKSEPNSDSTSDSLSSGSSNYSLKSEIIKKSETSKSNYELLQMLKEKNKNDGFRFTTV